MSDVEKILSAEDEEAIVEAIRKAEKTTSGEIRIHLESEAPEEAIDRAAEVFQMLKMNKTRERNGVLIYVAVKSRVFVIYGDKGINEAVPEGFWDSTRDIMLHYFKKGDFKQGIIEGILKSGEQLQKYFPWDKNDKNELPDDISRG